MNSGKQSSSKELTVVSVRRKTLSENILNRISMGVRVLFGRTLPNTDKSSGKNPPNKEVKVLPNIGIAHLENSLLEGMMKQIANGVNQLPDEWIISEAQRLFTQFGDGTKPNREREIEFINSDIMPLMGKGEQLPTIFLGNCSTIIEKFGIIIKERLERIRQEKLAELMDNISKRVDQLPDNDSVIQITSNINTVLGKRIGWDNELNVEYINQVLMPFIKVKENLIIILERDADTIIEGFHRMIQQKAISILQKKRAKLVPRITRSK